jgi:hypothetical protein
VLSPSTFHLLQKMRMWRSKSYQMTMMKTKAPMRRAALTGPVLLAHRYPRHRVLPSLRSPRPRLPSLSMTMEARTRGPFLRSPSPHLLSSPMTMVGRARGQTREMPTRHWARAATFSRMMLKLSSTHSKTGVKPPSLMDGAGRKTGHASFLALHTKT